jgi:hypothetical protein
MIGCFRHGGEDGGYYLHTNEGFKKIECSGHKQFIKLCMTSDYVKNSILYKLLPLQANPYSVLARHLSPSPST